MTRDQKIHLLQDHFDYLDKVANVPGHPGAATRSGANVMALSILDRDLYFVLDVTAITCNSGMAAWIDYHIDDRGWIDEAARAFEAIGHPRIGANLKECRDRYLGGGRNFEGWDDERLSASVWQAEESLYEDLYNHLEDQSFQFKSNSKGK